MMSSRYGMCSVENEGGGEWGWGGGRGGGGGEDCVGGELVKLKYSVIMPSS